MAKVNYVRYCITFAFFSLINIESSGGLGTKNFECDAKKCTCRTVPDNGFGYDISPLENTAGYLTYSNNHAVYFFHPCSDMKLPAKNLSQCSVGFTVCLFNASAPSPDRLSVDAVLAGTVNGSFYALASAAQADFQASLPEPYIIYKSVTFTTKINLVCDEVHDAKSELSLKDPNANLSLPYHELVLKSPYSCYRNLSHEKHYMSGTAVFFIIVLTIAAAYFFGGMLVLRHIKGATGTEMIPNYDFWVSLPGRLKSCVMRLLGKESHGPNSYESI